MKIHSDRIAWQEIDGELVLLDLVSSSYLTTNQTGAFLAKLLQEEHTRDELASALVAEYEIDEAQAGADTDSFLSALSELDLLES
ncbi:hypothetical protein GCM10023221_12710 [Luteimicrobium xylanilyticum]|uniref:Coenzyme PQQ synthesis protein n=1 Tax=Luteimicrobium xylanilyticum TaxID=1133546 RepID=A0A5P9QDD3_9MICO|nr:PqqD family protein [Luteimicrobium xylanilyticum]QFU99256.1 hypothetical protein KDY119_02783 [Luteimicrobium xylanilyticum]